MVVLSSPILTVGDMVVSFLSLGWGCGGIFLVTGNVVVSSLSCVGNIVVSSFCHWIGAMAVSSLSWKHVGVSLVTTLWTWWDHPCWHLGVMAVPSLSVGGVCGVTLSIGGGRGVTMVLVTLWQNGDASNPACRGIAGVLEAYQRSLRRVQLYGPTNFAPVVNHVAR